MSVSRGRRSRESRASPSERRKDSRKINAVDKKFLRTLLRVLAKVVDEKGEFTNDDDSMAAILEESDSESESEKKKDAKGADAREKSTQPPPGQATKANEKREIIDETKNVARFQKLRENHGQLTDQIQSSLNALGGGGRTAKALERMHEEVKRITGLFYDEDNEKTDRLRPDTCTEILNSSREAASEIAEAFKELGMFNKSFFDTLERLTKQLETIAVKLDVEYGSYGEFGVDKYLDSVFEPLIEDFDAFLHGLTNIAEKEIATIRNAQDFSSQRYLNLTTVATFLSSVTATTLQITADDSGSALTSVANTLWLISLVFSTASAVYSLLVMTWRQSSVCQPNLALPSFLNPWFRNGPMYTLIAAVMTFSIGLCLLAFHVALDQGGLASAIVPTAFAGLHAYAIFLFSAWFLLEQWKSRHKDNWVKVRDVYLTPLAKTAESHADRIRRYSRRVQESPKNIRESGRRVLSRLAKLFTSFTSQIPTFRRHVVAPSGVKEGSIRDIESGRDASPAPNVIISEEPAITLSEYASEAIHTPEAAEPGNALAIPEAVPLPESDADTNATGDDSHEEMEDKYKPFESLLQFSPDGRLLASGFTDTVTIYDVENLFTILSTIKTPDADEVKQIEWNPRFELIPAEWSSDELNGELLVRSLSGISVWNVQYSKAPNGFLVGHLKESVGFAKWTDLYSETIGFGCATDCTIRLFNDKCEEVRSIDLSKMRKVNRITLAAFFRDKYIICLADVPDDTYYDSLLVVNWKENSVDSGRPMYRGHTSMIVSSAANKILFHGSETGAEVADMLISESGDDFTVTIDNDYRLWTRTYGGHELSSPEAGVTFYGKNDGLFLGYSSGEIVVLYRRPTDEQLAMHIFTTLTAESIPRSPVSFTVNRGTNSKPYMFAFGDYQGTVTVWSIQSNGGLAKSEKARVLEVHDRRGAHSEKPVSTTGRFLILQPQRIREDDDANVARPLSLAS